MFHKMTIIYINNTTFIILIMGPNRSLIMQDVKSEPSSNLVKLCFIILTCIAEDQYANALMIDPHLVFRVRFSTQYLLTLTIINLNRAK